MSSMKSHPIFYLLILGSLISTPIHATTFTVKNNCQQTVWGAAIPGGGNAMSPGATWTLDVPSNTNAARIWGRTGCTSNGPNGLTCTTGDCGGVLNCVNSGATPTTLAEYTLTGSNNMDTFDISLVDGFNLPMSFKPASGCSNGPSCAANINDSCLSDLKVNQGCLSACEKFNTDEYCCRNQFVENCPPSTYSMFFKNQCPDAYSYAKDDATSTFTCPPGTNYVITFCP
ncbi:hypothetical protein SOVF_065480 [Spinacia oleracea]|uniref:Pathogenesis-related 5 protein Cup a 3-like n=1 Tax=Spinacia oleracea TaxID=3562 RepID=A0A9R0IU17_SPIOL|nr:pathogenesis-related 5 protein Cup a 3-like [Spinacia oleracea]KNA19020.1 hypothetical protein SOVF_065480 [Spinacia oleracea]